MGSMPVADAARLALFGMSHVTAPVDVRERVALNEEGVRDFLRRLREDAVADEALVLSTCNRTEVYAVPREPEALAQVVGAFRGPTGERLDAYWVHRTGDDVVRHLFRVASSLESLVVGEPQILGQVREAVRVANEVGTLGDTLGAVSERALAVARRVRTDTTVGRSTVGVGNAGVDLAVEIFGGLSGRRVLLLGTGEMGRQVAKALMGAGAAELMVSNRTFDGAVELAREHGGAAVPWEHLQDHLPRADVVVCATGAPKVVLSAAQMAAAMRERRWRPVCLVDLAVPRNLDPAIGAIDEAFLFDIDDLSRVVERGREARSQAAIDAGHLVDEEARRFLASLRELDVSEDLRTASQFGERMRLIEIERSAKALQGLSPEAAEAVDAMTKALVKRLLHPVLGAVKEAGQSGDDVWLKRLRSRWQ